MLTHEAVVSAARRAVRSGAVEGVVLFGSRARGDAHAASDWDLCLVGPDETRALEAVSDAFRGENVDLVWTDARSTVHEGTVWAEIIREGRAIAGRWERLMSKKIRAVSAQRVEERLGNLLFALDDCDRYLRHIPTSRGARSTLSMRSTQGAEAVGMLYCALAGIRYSGRHEMDLVREALAAAALDDPTRGKLLCTMSVLIGDTNGDTRQVRRAEYLGPQEPLRASVRRLEATRYAGAELVRGVLRGTGTLGALRGDAHARRYAAAITATEPVAHDTGQWERLYDCAPRKALAGTPRALFDRTTHLFVLAMGSEEDIVLGGGGALALRWGHRTTTDLEYFGDPGRFDERVRQEQARVRTRLESAASPCEAVVAGPQGVRVRRPEGCASLAPRRRLGPEHGPVERVGHSDVPLEPVEQTLVHLMQRIGQIPRADARTVSDTTTNDVYDAAAADVYAPHALRTALAHLSRGEHARLVECLEVLHDTWDADRVDGSGHPVHTDIARHAPVTVVERARACEGPGSEWVRESAQRDE